jgi:lysylphosphatidylglycerol synthetase-like protein (DUF2156 family)
MTIPIHDLWWLAAGGGASAGARFMKVRIDAALTARRRSRLPDPTGELLRLQTLYGYNPHSLVSIAPGALLWSTPDIDGAIIYGEFGRVWLAAGDPLAPLEDVAEMSRQFAAFAKRKNRMVAFVPASSEFAHAVAPRDFVAVKCGASPYFDLQNWNPRGDCAKKMRAGINQARRAGVEVEMISHVDAALKKETAELCLRWLDSHRAATTFGWLVALDPFLHSEHKKYFAARVDGKLVGFLAASPIPKRNAWYLEDVLREPDAPNGTSTLLVFEAFANLKAEGAPLATLGTAPLTIEGQDDLRGGHPMVLRTLDMASRHLGGFYNFEGLHRFKARFVPSWWESEYVVSQRGVTIPSRVGHAIVRALVPGGLTQILTRQALRVLRDSSPTIREGSPIQNVTRTLKSSSKVASRK